MYIGATDFRSGISFSLWGQVFLQWVTSHLLMIYSKIPKYRYINLRNTPLQTVKYIRIPNDCLLVFYYDRSSCFKWYSNKICSQRPPGSPKVRDQVVFSLCFCNLRIELYANIQCQILFYAVFLLHPGRLSIKIKSDYFVIRIFGKWGALKIIS